MTIPTPYVVWLCVSLSAIIVAAVHLLAQKQFRNRARFHKICVKCFKHLAGERGQPLKPGMCDHCADEIMHKQFSADQRATN